MIFKKTWKLIAFAVLIIGYILHSLVNRVRSKDLNVRRRYYVKTVSFWSRQALKLAKFKVNYINAPAPDKPYLFVGNHLGMFDILVLAQLRPSLFITSIEMKNTPFLGFLTEMGGCLYVERRSRSNIVNEMLEIRQALQDGFSVTLYPEGTSSDGQGLLPLKKTLMTSAAGTGVPIKPVVINFNKVNGEKVSSKWRNHICWYGEQTFFPSLFLMFELDSIEVDFEFCDEIVVHNEEERRQVAALVQNKMLERFRPIPLAPGEYTGFTADRFAAIQELVHREN